MWKIVLRAEDAAHSNAVNHSEISPALAAFRAPTLTPLD
jgi:hypothetical protein